MRIIAGEFRGRKLLPPASDSTRPITDRAKQSLFDTLDSAGKIDGATVFDCFAGTGSMGLECLSRGASHASFFEADRSALDRLRRNIAALSVANRATVIAGDLFKHFQGPLAGNSARASLVFLDPPYRFVRERASEIQDLARTIVQHLAPNGIVVFRHDAADTLDLPPFSRKERRQYGSMRIELLANG